MNKLVVLVLILSATFSYAKEDFHFDRDVHFTCLEGENSSQKVKVEFVITKHNKILIDENGKGMLPGGDIVINIRAYSDEKLNSYLNFQIHQKGSSHPASISMSFPGSSYINSSVLPVDQLQSSASFLRGWEYFVNCELNNE